MPTLQSVTVRTASRMPIGNGFQEVGVSLSFLVTEPSTSVEVVAHVSAELREAFQQLWRELDGDDPKAPGT